MVISFMDEKMFPIINSLKSIFSINDLNLGKNNSFSYINSRKAKKRTPIGEYG